MPIDLRSDPITQPTPAMHEAMARAEVGDDVFGDDPTVARLEARTAEILGKKAAVFTPSGTMANQLALQAHTEPGAGETLQPALPGTLLMWNTTLRRADGSLTFGPQHEMGLSFRIATPFVVKGGSGSIVCSHGGKNQAGNRGRIGSWWDYPGTMNGRHAGVLVCAATDNSRPVWSHARDYGFLAMNPTGPPPGVKDVPSLPFTVPTGATLALKFGVLLHASPEFMDLVKAAPVVSAELKTWE